MKKVILAIALISGVATVSNAGTPKGEAKEAKTEAKSDAQLGTTYYITGETTKDGQPAYEFNTQPQDCDGSNMPCQITTTSGTLTSPVLKSVVNNPAQVHIDSYQD